MLAGQNPSGAAGETKFLPKPVPMPGSVGSRFRQTIANLVNKRDHLAAAVGLTPPPAAAR
jgi:hypothetical protein